MKALGLLGGTFDPVHFGHLRLGIDALEELSLDGIRWVPSGVPGHRNAPLVSATHRLEMLRLAIADEPRFQIDTAELNAVEPTYTINTFKRLRLELGNEIPLVMLIGMDSLLSLHTWREWQKLFDFAHFAVAKRPGSDLNEAEMDPNFRALYRERCGEPAALSQTSHGRVAQFGSVPLAVSATDIRSRLAHNRSVRYLIPATVLRYIESNALYR